MKILRRDPNVGYLDNWFWIPKHHIDCEGIKNALSMRFLDAYAEEKVRYVFLYKETETHLLVPRFLWNPSQMPFRVVDCRPREFPVTGVRSRIKLDHRKVNGELVHTGDRVQQKAMDALLRADSGILELGCGLGKTVIALDLVARLGGPALIILDNTNLMAQWKDDIEEFLEVPGGIGLIQAEVCDWEKAVVLATYHTLGAIAPTMSERMKRHFRVVIYDEAHHVAAATFAPSAEVFYGMRLALTATKNRSDGLHVIYDNHIGPTIYKDITHRIKPRIVFRWTGLKVDATSDVYDTHGKIHLSKVSSFCGKWLARLQLILSDVDEAVRAGRKILVLCNAVDEAVNLCALWTLRNWHQPQGTMYTDIPVPTPQEVGKNIHPIGLTTEQRTYIEAELEKKRKALLAVTTPEAEQRLRFKIAEMELHLEQDDVNRLVSAEFNKRQKSYRSWLLENLTNAGLMIHKVDAESRMEYIRTKQVVFAITKYGKEGLDDEYLDTVLASTPFSDRNGLQQLMGRPTRRKAGKKSPLVVFYEDDIGPLIGMCKKLRGHLTAWPVDENGPFEFELHGHPRSGHRSYPPIFADIQRGT